MAHDYEKNPKLQNPAAVPVLTPIRALLQFSCCCTPTPTALTSLFLLCSSAVRLYSLQQTAVLPFISSLSVSGRLQLLTTQRWAEFDRWKINIIKLCCMHYTLFLTVNSFESMKSFWFGTILVQYLSLQFLNPMKKTKYCKCRMTPPKIVGVWFEIGFWGLLISACVFICFYLFILFQIYLLLDNVSWSHYVCPVLFDNLLFRIIIRACGYIVLHPRAYLSWLHFMYMLRIFCSVYLDRF